MSAGITRVGALLVGESSASIPTEDGVLLRSMGGALQQATRGGSWMPLGGVTGLISGGTNFADLTAAIAQANATGGGATIALGKGTYRLTAQSILTANGISIVGNGPGSTYLEIDDAGGMAGADAFVWNSVLRCAFKGLTFTATTARTAGSFLKVKGKNNITHTPAQRVTQYTIEDVDAEDQFNGVSFVDGDAGAGGCWGGFINRGEWIRFSAGGTYVDINSPAGGQHYITNLKIYGSDSLTNANRALAAIRYRGGADIEMANVNSVYLRSGLLIDPPNGQAANVTTAVGCLWDNNTLASVLVAPAAGGTAIGIKLTDNWGYTPPAAAQACLQFDGGESIAVIGGTYWGNYHGCRVSGPARYVTVMGADFSGSIAGLYTTLNAQDFNFAGNIVAVRGTVPTVGIQVDAGCDHYSITGNNLRGATTPMTITPLDSANRRVATGGNNITL